MNKKEEKVWKLWDKGIKDIVIIARKLGYTGAALTHGIEEVRNIISKEKLIGFITGMKLNGYTENILLKALEIAQEELQS